MSDDVVDDGLNRRVDRDGDRPLIGLWRFQRLELAVEQAGRHEMALAPGKALGDQRLVSIEEDEADVVAPAQQYVSIGVFQSRAGNHDMAARFADAADLIGDRFKPRPAVFVGQRMSGAHLFDVARGVKAVAVFERPLQTLGERSGNRALSRARYAHHAQGAERRFRSVAQANYFPIAA